MKISRWLRHLGHSRLQLRRHFPPACMRAIQLAIAQSEAHHAGELVFAVQAALNLHDLLRGVTPREHAIETFSRLRVWDTEHNSGVLIYLLLAERRVEIIADRGIHARVGDAGWQDICRQMENRFRCGRFEEGAMAAIARVGALLAQHFPAEGANPNELPDSPVVA